MDVVVSTMSPNPLSYRIVTVRVPLCTVMTVALCVYVLLVVVYLCMQCLPAAISPSEGNKVSAYHFHFIMSGAICIPLICIV